MDSFYVWLFLALAAPAAWLELQQTSCLDLFGSRNGRSEDQASFNRFRNNYVLVFSLMMAGDWLQGPYVYHLYEVYGFSVKDIGLLFIMGFGSSAILGTLVGALADLWGRKKAALLYVVCYVLSCLTKHSRSFGVLLVGRLLGGTATSLLFSAFESWAVATHTASKFESRLLGDLFTKAVFMGNGLMAILAGLFGNLLVENLDLGPVAPFDAAAVVLLVGGAIVWHTWGENYGYADGAGLLVQFRSALNAIRDDERIALLGAMQALFEASMYTFVFLWTPALSPHGEALPHGFIFAIFMTASMLGTALAGQLMTRVRLEHFMQVVFWVACASLLVPAAYHLDRAPSNARAELHQHKEQLLQKHQKMQLQRPPQPAAAVHKQWKHDSGTMAPPLELDPSAGRQKTPDVPVATAAKGAATAAKEAKAAASGAGEEAASGAGQEAAKEAAKPANGAVKGAAKAAATPANGGVKGAAKAAARKATADVLDRQRLPFIHVDSQVRKPELLQERELQQSLHRTQQQQQEWEQQLRPHQSGRSLHSTQQQQQQQQQQQKTLFHTTQQQQPQQLLMLGRQPAAPSAAAWVPAGGLRDVAALAAGSSVDSMAPLAAGSSTGRAAADTQQQQQHHCPEDAASLSAAAAAAAAGAAGVDFGDLGSTAAESALPSSTAESALPGSTAADSNTAGSSSKTYVGATGVTELTTPCLHDMLPLNAAASVGAATEVGADAPDAAARRSQDGAIGSVGAAGAWHAPLQPQQQHQQQLQQSQQQQNQQQQQSQHQRQPQEQQQQQQQSQGQQQQQRRRLHRTGTFFSSHNTPDTTSSSSSTTTTTSSRGSRKAPVDEASSSSLNVPPLPNWTDATEPDAGRSSADNARGPPHSSRSSSSSGGGAGDGSSLATRSAATTSSSRREGGSSLATHDAASSSSSRSSRSSRGDGSSLAPNSTTTSTSATAKGTSTTAQHPQRRSGLTWGGRVQLLAFCVFEVIIGLFWPSMMTLRALYVPEEERSTIINIFRIPLNLFVCIILWKVSQFPLGYLLALCSLFLAAAACCTAKLATLTSRDKKSWAGDGNLDSQGHIPPVAVRAEGRAAHRVKSEAQLPS